MTRTTGFDAMSLEREARRLRAEALRDMVAGLVARIGRLRSAKPQKTA